MFDRDRERGRVLKTEVLDRNLYPHITKRSIPRQLIEHQLISQVVDRNTRVPGCCRRVSPAPVMSVAVRYRNDAAADVARDLTRKFNATGAGRYFHRLPI